MRETPSLRVSTDRHGASQQHLGRTFSASIRMDSPYQDALGHGMGNIAEDAKYVEVVVR